MVKSLTVQCLAGQEAFAEKFRAALSRRDAAIRDFYDIASAVRNAGVRPDAEEFIALVKRKLAVLGNEPVDVSAERFNAVRRQVVTQLKPVLRSKDFAEFDLEWALGLATEMALKVSG